MEKYYRIRPNTKQNIFGFIVKIDGDRIFRLNGLEEDLSKYGCVIKDGNLKVGRGYFSKEITQEKAEKLSEKSLNAIASITAFSKDTRFLNK